MCHEHMKFILTIILLIVSIFVASNYSGYYTCNNYQKVTNTQTKWVTLDACYVNTKTGWQRWDEYKARATANNLKD